MQTAISRRGVAVIALPGDMAFSCLSVADPLRSEFMHAGQLLWAR